MKQQIYLKRKATSQAFKSIAKGLYPNAVLKIDRRVFEPGRSLTLYFELLSHSPLEKTPLGFNLQFNKDEIPEKFEGGIPIDVGHPPLSHLLENYLDLDENGAYLTNEYGKMWFLLQSRVTLPNGLGETNLSEWEFMTDEEIAALTFPND